ncbi:hypothetical protein EMCRGX_G020194 [Ephydatia muelleri]
MADCLSLLRQYNIQKKEIVERDGLIIFDQVAFPKNAKTNHLIYRTGQAGTPKEYYTLESLLFLLKNVSLSHPMYVQRAGAQSIPVIKFPDRRGLLSFLNGEVESTSSIDKSVHLLEMGIQAPPPKRQNEERHGGEAAKKMRVEDEERDKLRLAKKLEAKQEGGGVTTDQLRPLSDALSEEKIASIKAKRLAKKRGTIKTDDDIAGGMDRVVVDDITKDVLSKERVHRTRTSVLQSASKTFANVFNVLQMVRGKDEGKGEDGDLTEAPEEVVDEEEVESKQSRPQAPPMRGYNRYDQEKFKPKEADTVFKIDVKGSNDPLANRTTGLVTQQQGGEKPSNNNKGAAAQNNNKRTASDDSSNDLPRKKDHRSRTPIIIVPAATTSVITMYNARDFLEEFRYVPSEEKKTSGVKREVEMIIHRKKPHPTQPGQSLSIPYRVIDNPLRLSPQEWKQVVAVFVAGPTWQFKGWPGVLSDGSPVDIFTKVKAFHIKFDELKADKNIQQWDVQVLQISRSKRHLDKASMLQCWDSLERYMSLHHPELSLQTWTLSQPPDLGTFPASRPGHFPSLQTWALSQPPDLGTFPASRPGHFPSLQTWALSQPPDLGTFPASRPGHFPSLQTWALSQPPGLDTFPASRPGHFPSLQTWALSQPPGLGTLLKIHPSCPHN